MAAPTFADRVEETTVTTGTGTYDLAGAAAGFQGFVAGIGDTKECFYCVTDDIDFEVGKGTIADAAPDTLSRDTILESSNADAAVNWSAGIKKIFCVVPKNWVDTPTVSKVIFSDIVQLLFSNSHLRLQDLGGNPVTFNAGIYASGANAFNLLAAGLEMKDVGKILWAISAAANDTKDASLERELAGRIRTGDGLGGYGDHVAEVYYIRDVGAADEAFMFFQGGNVKFSDALRANVSSLVTSYFARLGFEGKPAFASGDGSQNAGLFFTLDGSDGLPHMAARGKDVTEWDSKTDGVRNSLTDRNGAQKNGRSKMLELTALSGASVTTSGLVPAGARLLWVVARVTTLITGATSFDVGDGSSAGVDKYGDNIAVAAGTTVDHINAKADPMSWSAAAQEVTLTAVGPNFTAGAVRIVAFYEDTTAPTS